jgi:hypothetical protein
MTLDFGNQLRLSSWVFAGRLYIAVFFIVEPSYAFCNLNIISFFESSIEKQNLIETVVLQPL